MTDSNVFAPSAPFFQRVIERIAKALAASITEPCTRDHKGESAPQRWFAAYRTPARPLRDESPQDQHRNMWRELDYRKP